MAGPRILLAMFIAGAQLLSAPASHDAMFYVPENPRYTICDSAVDSLRFTADKTLRPDEHGHLVSISSFVDSDGQVMSWHAFGNLEGPGWAANAVGGAYEMYAMGAFLHRPEWQSKALSVRYFGLRREFKSGDFSHGAEVPKLIDEQEALKARVAALAAK